MFRKRASRKPLGGLGFMTSVAVAQDPPKEQPKDEPQASQQPTDKEATTQAQPADAVDPRALEYSIQ